ncbi:MAG TPA: GNAT family N-acetyltransferase [Actinomycetes bacterium]|nr:GNAT family N-acetyltransferase [Actinomycetes bacterium]
MTARRLASAAELHALAPHDAYVAQVDDSAAALWAGDDGAVGWLVRSPRWPGSGHLTCLGDPSAAVALLGDVLLEDGEVAVGSASLSRDVVPLLPTHLRLEPANDWEWLATTTLPPVQPGEDRVRWLGEPDHDDITELLRTHSGRHDAEPGQDHARRWCGVRDGSGELVAVAAHTEFWTGVPFLASVATRSDQRGRGLGGAVTAWVTRRLLEERRPRVTLGMYSDNDVARRLYLRLGYQVVHRFTSGRLRRGDPAGVSD